MNKILALTLICLVLTSATPIKNVIVLMLENRSFDHLLGHLGKTDPRIDGLNGQQSNPLDPTNPNSPKIGVNFHAVDDGPDDPCHSFGITVKGRKEREKERKKE